MSSYFIEISKEKFKFLEEKYGAQLEVISDDVLIWRFEGYRLSIVYDSRWSYELNVLLSKDGDQFSTFDLHALIRYAEVVMENYTFQGFSASTEERVEIIVAKMANLLSLVCNKIVLFSSETIYRLKQQRTRECVAYAKNNKLEKLRVDAEKAWKEKEYAMIKALYEPFLDDLTKSEIKKYEYALKHLR